MVKTRRRRTNKAKPSGARVSARRRGASVADLQEQLDGRTRELKEAREQQAATADVLKVISRSTFDLQAVLDALVHSAAKLCEADRAAIHRREGDYYPFLASYGFPREFNEFMRNREFRPESEGVLGRALIAAKTIHVPDIEADPADSKAVQEWRKIGGYRTLLCVPLMREGTVIGAIVLTRIARRPFTEKQIELVQTFADQAVIAMENVRLFEAEQHRTRELSESLEQQTATTNVLRVISSSPGELEPVFQAMLENAVRICDAAFGNLMLYDGEAFRFAALHGALPKWEEMARREPVLRVRPSSPLGRVAASKQLNHIEDIGKEQAYVERQPATVALAELAGARTVLNVPMLKDNELIGTFSIYRSEVRPFTDKQIAVVQNFAAQAVIAIENTRLLNGLRESLEQQTASADVLRIISSSPDELKLVFATILDKALHLCEAAFGVATTYDGERFECAAERGVPNALTAYFRAGMDQPRPGDAHWRLAAGEDLVHNLDQKDEEAYWLGNPLRRAVVDLGGARSTLVVALRKDKKLLGALTVYRKEVRPFTDQQISLLQNFAAQAVIAIENARLLNELRESLQQQTATADVLRVISSSPGELEPVFQAMLDNATRICEAEFGSMQLRDGDAYRRVALHNAPPKFVEFSNNAPILERGTASSVDRAIDTRQVVHILDVAAENPNEPIAKFGGARTLLVVPMLKENEPIGAFGIYRQEVRSFTDKQIALVQNFAAQAVIAIENTRLLNEQRESLQQQTATADVLKTISRSTFDLQTVLDTLVQSAARLCRADRSTIRLAKDGLYYHLASQGFSPEHKGRMEREPVKADRSSIVGRVVLEGKSVHVVDSQADPNPELANRSRSGNIHTILGVPLQREGVPIGVLLLQRTIVQPFTDKEIALAESFADQAVIAIENVRLFEAEQQRTRELSESLEQQTATSEVLRVISSSPGDLKPVFQAILANATQICEAKYGNLYQYADGVVQIVASHSASAALAAERLRQPPFRPGPATAVGRVIQTKAAVQVADVLTDPGYPHDDPLRRAAEQAGVRTVLSVPMLKENELAGAITIVRQEVRPFTEKQIQLVTNFAAQAVIAIENARLLTELRQSLEQQTATSEVLRVISSSPTNVQPVFDSIAESAVRLCGGQFSIVLRFDGKVMDFASCFGLNAEGLNALRSMLPRPASEDTASGRAILCRAVVEIADVEADPALGAQAQRVAYTVTYRSIVAVPLLHEGDTIGTIAVARANAGAFPERQIALLKAFADQAVIAIRNVRLFDEVQARTEELSESVEELRALGEVSQAINSTLDVERVLTTIVAKAVQLSATEAGTIYTFDNSRQEFQPRATHGMDERMIATIRDRRIGVGETAIGKAAAEKTPIQIADTLKNASLVLDIVVQAGFRALLAVPLLRSDQIIGALVVRRKEPGAFPEHTVKLLQTFADQSVLAIQNARLYREVEEKSRELADASQHKSQFLANMSHELRTPLNAILGYTELMADGAYGEPSEKMLGILKRLEANGRHLLGLINDVLDLSKIEAGQLVLELSDYSIQDIAQTVRSTLEPLAADKKLAFKLELAPELPPGRGDGRRLTQVLINLVGNAIKFTDAGEVVIKAEANNGAFQVSVRDTGPGISAADQAKLFQEFQQADNAITKKKGGTGLGLAISKRIIEMHSGKIWVESQPGQGSTFAFTLPVVVERQAEPA